jgi:hypothetical protein
VKRRLTVISLMAGAMFFSGCLGLNSGLAVRGSGGSGVSGGSGGSGESLGIDPITQAGIDATTAATQEQSNQDTQAAFDQISANAAASANQ